MVECLPSMNKCLGWIPNTIKRKRKKGRQGRKEKGENLKNKLHLTAPPKTKAI